MTITELRLPPLSDLTGTHQMSTPLPVDGSGYVPPRLLGVAYASFVNQTGSTQSYAFNKIVLPEIAEIENATADISIVDTSDYYEDTYQTDHAIEYPTDPTKPILADDVILIWVNTWSDLTTSGPSTPTGYTQAWSYKDAGDTYSCRLTLFYKVATGSESGEVDLTMGVGIPLTASMEIWRGVDTSNVFDASESGPTYGNNNPNPPAITTVTDGAVVIAATAARVWGGKTTSQPSGYRESITNTFNRRSGLTTAWKTIGTAATEDPGSFSYVNDESTVVTVALRPATAPPGVTFILAASSSHTAASTGGTILDALLESIDEVQELNSTLTSGTFTITFDGDTTANINWDDTAASIETAINNAIGANEVRCSGGPLDEGPVSVEFIGSTYDATDLALMTTSNSNVTVTEVVKGAVGGGWAHEGDINVPRSGGSYEPQTRLYSLSPAAYIPGQRISVATSSQLSVKTWTVVLTIWTGLDTSNPVETFGTQLTGTDMQGEIGAITPATSGSIVLAAVSKALVSANFYDTAIGGTVAPARATVAATAVADSMSLDIFHSPPVDDSEFDFGPATWRLEEAFSTGSVSLKPETAPTGGLDMADVLLAEGESTWAEIAATAGDLYEVVEMDLGSLPNDAYVIGASVRFAHSADAEHRISATPCAITAGGEIVLAEDPRLGYMPLPLGSIVTEEGERIDSLADGTDWNDYTRYGIAFRSTAGAPNLSTHKVYWAEVVLDVLEGGPLVTNVAGPVNNGDSVTWTYSSAGGHPQTHYQVMFIAGASQDPDSAVIGNPWSATAGDLIYDSGQLAGPNIRSFIAENFPLSRGDCTVAVRSWARLAGRSIPSDWATANYNITGSPPSTPTVNTSATFDETRGIVSVVGTTPSNATRLFLHRSIDGGSTYQVCRTPASLAEVGTSTQGTVYDVEPPNGVEVIYRLGCDSGDMSEAVWITESTKTWTVDRWYLQAPAEPDESITLNIVAGTLSRSRPRPSQLVQGSDSAMVVSSPELLATWEMRIRVTDRSEREALDTLLSRSDALRLVSVLGDTYTVRPYDDVTETMQRWQALSTETTPLRDSHEVTLKLAEVTR